ncbi:GGDEF domain-containing protein [Butyrivibrio sp. NC2002]|uniref:GGDEF domain-containing protein n=1 Tax=Butyrivibrio sp. NC2002 TaxID=1410610 RepID=UPI00056807E9|nr:GGDEF domain-containing protein [Butyrivibrio sp. NC2002]
MKKAAAFLTIAFITFLILIAICDDLFAPVNPKSIQRLNDGWTVVYNGETYEDVSLSGLRKRIGHPAEKGDVIEMSTKISGIKDLTFPSLLFLSRYSAYEVYFNDTRILSEYIEDYKENRYIGVKNNFITLPYEANEGIITIRLFVNEDKAYNYFDAPVFGSFHDVKAQYIYSNLFPLGVSVLLIIFGAAFLIITLSFYRTLPDILSQLFTSLLFIDLGVWIMAYYRLWQLFIYAKGHYTEIEYFSLYLMVPLMYMIIGCINKHYSDWIFQVVTLTSVIICIFIVALHVTGIAHVNSTLIYYQCLALVCFFFLLLVIGRDVEQKKLSPSEKIQLLGLLCLAVSFLIHFGLFVFSSVGIVSQSDYLKKSVPMGSLVFLFATLINYFIYVSESYARRREFASLTRLAYADGLTNLPNRSRYDKYMSDLEKTGEDYCIISLDLNGLKQINDNDGHVAGDNYLKDFSTVLLQCFENKGFIARIGGDEFVAVLIKENIGDAEAILARLKDALEVKNVLYPVYKRSVAAGYAFRHEVPSGDSHSVYLLADNRMYENKKIMHEKLGIRVRI